MVFGRYPVRQTHQMGLFSYSDEQLYIVFDLCCGFLCSWTPYFQCCYWSSLSSLKISSWFLTPNTFSFCPTREKFATVLTWRQQKGLSESCSPTPTLPRYFRIHLPSVAAKTPDCHWSRWEVFPISFPVTLFLYCLILCQFCKYFFLWNTQGLCIGGLYIMLLGVSLRQTFHIIFLFLWIYFPFSSYFFSLYTDRLLKQFQHSKTDSHIQFDFLEDKSFPYYQ